MSKCPMAGRCYHMDCFRGNCGDGRVNHCGDHLNSCHVECTN